MPLSCRTSPRIPVDGDQGAGDVLHLDRRPETLVALGRRKSCQQLLHGFVHTTVIALDAFGLVFAACLPIGLRKMSACARADFPEYGVVAVKAIQDGLRHSFYDVHAGPVQFPVADLACRSLIPFASTAARNAATSLP